MAFPILHHTQNYRNDPRLGDVLYWANRWIDLPKGVRLDLCGEDMEAYRSDRPFLGPIIAANWLLDNGILRWVEPGNPHHPGNKRITTLRMSNVYIVERVYNWDTVDVRCARDLDYRRLLQTCAKCGTEFLCYKPMDKRRYCSSECQRRRKNRDYQRRRRLTQREECAMMSHGHSTDDQRPGDPCAPLS